MSAKQYDTTVLTDELKTPLVRYLKKRVRINEDANDLAQEAFLRMHAFQQSNELENARAFLFKTAKNLAVDQIRRSNLHEKYVRAIMPVEQFSLEESSFAPSAESTAAVEQELDRIYEVIEDLPVKVKTAFQLHRSKNMSYTAIAKEMSVSTSMVEKYIVEALRILRKELA